MTHATSGPAAEFWRRTLLQIRTHFGRLMYLARLRDDGGGRYYYRALEELVGGELTDRTLANSHYLVFSEWIAFPLARQKADLDDYLRETGDTPDMSVFRQLPPLSAHEVERQLFLTDLETLLALLESERGGAFSVPGA